METYIAHHGVKGMKWGVRRYETEDGHLTEAGKKRYYNADGSLTKKGIKEIPNKRYSHHQMKRDKSIYGEKGVRRINAELNKGNMISGARSLEAQRVERKEKRQKTAKKVAKVVIPATVSIAAATAALYEKNPAFRRTVDSAIDKVKDGFANAKAKKSKHDWSFDPNEGFKFESADIDEPDIDTPDFESVDWILKKDKWKRERNKNNFGGGFDPDEWD